MLLFFYEKKYNSVLPLIETADLGDGSIKPIKTSYTYDRLKRLSALTEMNTDREPTGMEKESHTTRYEYDIDGRQTAVIYPTSAGWKISKLEYEYDGNGWLTRIVAADGFGIRGILREYSYDEYGKIDTIQDYRAIREDGTLILGAGYSICKYEYDVLQRPNFMVYRKAVPRLLDAGRLGRHTE